MSKERGSCYEVSLFLSFDEKRGGHCFIRLGWTWGPSACCLAGYCGVILSLYTSCQGKPKIKLEMTVLGENGKYLEKNYLKL